MTFPAIAIVVEGLLFRENLRQHFKQGMIIFVIVALPFVIQFLLLGALHQPQTPADHEGTISRLHSYYEKAGLTLPEVVLTQCRVWFSYLFAIVAPFVQNTQLIKPEIISRSLWNPPATAAAALGILGLVGAAVGLSKKHPVGALGILFVLVTLLPESLLIPQYLFCGYRAILPMAGVLMVAADALAALRSRPDKWARQLAILVPILLVVCLSAFTFSQAKRWNAFSFWQDAYASSAGILP